MHLGGMRLTMKVVDDSSKIRTLTGASDGPGSLKALFEERDAALALIKELVECRDLANQLDDPSIPTGTPKWHTLRNEYVRRNLLAWKEARACVAGLPPAAKPASCSPEVDDLRKKLDEAVVKADEAFALLLASHKAMSAHYGADLGDALRERDQARKEIAVLTDFIKKGVKYTEPKKEGDHWYKCDYCGHAANDYFSVCEECGKMECQRVEANPTRPASLSDPAPKRYRAVYRENQDHFIVEAEERHTHEWEGYHLKVIEVRRNDPDHGMQYKAGDELDVGRSKNLPGASAAYGPHWSLTPFDPASDDET